MLGGGMRQAGIIAAPGIVALDTMISRLKEDHDNARRMANALNDLDGIEIDMSTGADQYRDHEHIRYRQDGGGVPGGGQEKRSVAVGLRPRPGPPGDPPRHHRRGRRPGGLHNRGTRSCAARAGPARSRSGGAPRLTSSFSCCPPFFLGSGFSSSSGSSITAHFAFLVVALLRL